MTKNRTKKLEAMMASIQETMLEKMLEDLNNPEKATPQLYNAIIKELQRNGVDCLPKAGEEGDNALRKLLDGVRNSLGDEYGTTLPN